MKKATLLFLFVGILSSCANDDTEIDTREFVPGEVSVGIKSGTDINIIFDFINQFDYRVDNINSLTYTSDLPSDSLQYVLDNLNEKNYTNDGVTWLVNGDIHYQTNQITIFPRLFEMNNVDYQKDWLTTMVELELNEEHTINLNSGIIRFYVPVGEEREWKNQFEDSDIVDWAELNYIADMEPYNE